MNNKNTSSIIGRIYDSCNFGKFIVLNEVISFLYSENEPRFKIKFLNTGFQTIASYSAIRHGKVRDKMVPNVAGIGYAGENITVTSPIYYRLYKTWNDMINRCYNIHDRDYYLYGAIGIKVDEEWFSFYNFYNDAIKLPGYDMKLKYPDIYQLDKDYLQFDKPKSQRIYSKYTCMWISKFDNILIMNREKENKSGYYGVVFNDNKYYTRINNIIYGEFTIPEAAANLFNYIYPLIKNEFNNITILNNVEPIPYEELYLYSVPNSKYTKHLVGSTTIPEMGVELK